MLVHSGVGLNVLFVKSFQSVATGIRLGSCLHVELFKASGSISNTSSLNVLMEDKEAEIGLWEAVRIPVPPFPTRIGLSSQRRTSMFCPHIPLVCHC